MLRQILKRLLFIIQAVFALFQAWSIKSRRSMFNVQFSPSGNLKQISAEDIAFLVSCTDFMVRFGTIRSGRKCFFRAYILGAVLHKWDVPVVMNVGLYNLTGSRRRRGHCWLTLNNEMFAESSDKVEKYKVKLATGVNGVRYWHGSGKINANSEVI